ncbi:MAG: hypothetical protein ACTS3R_04815 [Inquilinaceae bacterium]
MTGVLRRRRRVIPIAGLLTAAAALAGWSPPARAAEPCAPPRPPTVTVDTTFDPVTYHLDRPIDEIEVLATRGGVAVDGPDRHGLGLTTGFLGSSFRTEAQVRTMENGDVCLNPVLIDIEVGFRDTAVYVARELERGGCGHRMVLAHEEQHVAIERDVLRTHAPRVAEAMRRALADLTAVRGPTEKAAWAVLQDRIGGRLQTALDPMKEDLAARHAALDTGDEYARINRECASEMRRLFPG